MPYFCILYRYLPMKRSILIPLFAVFCLCVAFTAHENPLFSVPQGWQKPVYDFDKNKLTQEKIALGKRLFYDPILSKDSTISCASCHLSYTAFTHIDHALSHGISNRIGKRNSPVLVNLAWQNSFMWDGAVTNLELFSLSPMTHPDEMGDTLPNILTKLNRNTAYKKQFLAAFANENGAEKIKNPNETITSQMLLKSIAQFLVTIVSANSKYDKVMQKTAVFNEYEAKGYAIFKKNCNNCHTEPLFTSHIFENNGLEPDKDLLDSGRMGITKQTADALKFKVPTLRNIEVSYPYMHDGRFKNLQMVLFHYTNSIYKSPTLAPALKNGLTLTETDKINLIAFLKTLTDETFLHDKQFAF
jgi:cytochrome c peroxidase